MVGGLQLVDWHCLGEWLGVHHLAMGRGEGATHCFTHSSATVQSKDHGISLLDLVAMVTGGHRAYHDCGCWCSAIAGGVWGVGSSGARGWRNVSSCRGRVITCTFSEWLTLLACWNVSIANTTLIC